MPRRIATNTAVELEELLDFVRPRHHLVLLTRRRDGSPQLSPVAGGVDDAGRIVIATYPERAKARNARREPTNIRLWAVKTMPLSSQSSRSAAPGVADEGSQANGGSCWTR